MRQLYATLRHRPAPLAGILVALTLTAMFITWAISLAQAASSGVPAQRLANAAVVVTGNPTVAVTSGSGPSAYTYTVSLNGYRRLPDSVLTRLTAIPGVQDAVADQSVPLALQLPNHQIVTGTSAGPLTGYGWQSAILTPFRLQAGHAPAGPGQIVLGAGIAAATGLPVGGQVSLSGRPRALLTVVGIAAAPAGNPAGNQAVFFSPEQAAVLYNHPGQADLIGIVAQPGASPAVLAARVRAELLGRQLPVATGSKRGTAEDPGAGGDLSSFSVLAVSAGVINVLVSLFVAASTVALAVAERTRTWALLRAVGATPGQIRRTVMAELAVLGAIAGPAGYLPGIWLASLTVRGFADHQFIPASTRSWASPVEILPAAAAAIIIAEVSGFLAAHRASRVRPAVALGEATIDRRYPGPLRLVLGAAALVVAITVTVRVLSQPSASAQQSSQPEEALLAFVVAIAFLAPYLLGPAQRVLRLPLRVLGGIAGRLAAAELRARSRRMGTAAAAIALPVAYLGSIVVMNATAAHAAATQSTQRLAAAAIVSAPGPGLDPSVLPAIRQQPGVSATVGLTSTTVYLVEGAIAKSTMAEAVTSGRLPALPRLAVTSGSLQDFGPGDIALSQTYAEGGPSVGQAITTYLADGTPYPAKVTAVFSRSLGFADAIIPSAAAGGGHLGTSALSQVLIGASAGTSSAALTGHIAALSASYPGLQVVSRSVANAQYEQNASQDSYINNLLLSIIGLLVSVALVNTLVVATLQRRQELAVLKRVGATTCQLVAAATCQAAGLILIGVVLGIAAQIATVTTVSKTTTGSPVPYVPWQSVTIVLGLVALLTGLAILAPTITMARQHKGA